jgi:hypothetical protein
MIPILSSSKSLAKMLPVLAFAMIVPAAAWTQQDRDTSRPADNGLKAVPGPQADLLCIATAPDGVRFALSIEVRGQPPERTARIRSSPHDRFPSGATMYSSSSQTESQHGGARRETFYYRPRPGDYVLALTWRGGRVEDVRLFHSPAGMRRQVATATCEVELR